MKRSILRIGIAAHLSVLCALPNLSSASGPIDLNLEDAEQRALNNSLELVELNLGVTSILESKDSISKSQLPQIHLEGSATYLETVPEVQSGPVSIPLGDNENYSIGPTLTLSLWDGGIRSELKKSLELMANSQQIQAESFKTNLLLNVRLEYLKAILHKEEMKLVKERLSIVQLQNKDLKNKRKVGASSSLDLAESNREVHRYELDLEVKAEKFKSSVISLFHLTGDLDKVNSLPHNDLDGQIKLETLDSLIPRLRAASKGIFNEQNHAIQARNLKASSLYKEAESINSKRWPTINLRARTSYDYPNGPIQDPFNQNSVGITLSMPLIDWGKTSSEAKSKVALAKAEEARAKKLYEDSLKSWETIKAEVNSLNKRLTISEKLAEESAKVTRIKAASYRSGKINFTDLETAHFRELESRFELLRIKTLLFSNFALMASLSSGDQKL